MSEKRVKIIGYAKREFYDNGVEYRNFSDDLVGNQFTSDGGSTLFTLGNFKVTTNLDTKLSKMYRTNGFSRYYSLNKLKLENDKVLLGYKEAKQINLNLDKGDLSNYAYFGSLKEYIRVSLEEIIMKWPASLYVRKTDHLDPSTDKPTYLNYTYNALTNRATFQIDIKRIKNDYDINLKTNNDILNSYNRDNELRDMNLSYSDYVVEVNGVQFPVTNFNGYTNGTTVQFEIEGDAFTGEGIVNYHIKPKETVINKFFLELGDFGTHLLNRNTTPNYKAEFKYIYETDNGTLINGKKTVTWPTTDGYNLDFTSEYYVDYVTELFDIAEVNDAAKSNIITNRMVSNSLLEFDTIDGKIDKTLKIYGRSFDELKRHIDGLQFVNHVSYDKKNNIPDRLVKNLARTMGWELTSSLFNIDFNNDFLTTSGSLNLSPVESEIEFWRRLILNSPWVWKSKGTRKVVEFLLRFVGTPKGLVTFNEYVYTATNTLDVNEVKEVFEALDYDFENDNEVVDDEGYPKVPANTSGLYFQKGGLWYRKTGGEDSNIDEHKGNNPHIGPYDAGYEYINKFNEVIPNFSPVILDKAKVFTNIDQTFVNYDNGKFNSFFENDVRAEIDLNINFNSIYNSELNKCLSQFNLNECDLTTTWNLESYVGGELISDNAFFTSTDGSVPTSTDYTAGLESVKTTLSLDSSIEGGKYYLIERVAKDSVSELADKKIEFRTTLTFDYNCPNDPECGDLTIEGIDQDGVVLFSNNADNTVPLKECCHHIGYETKLHANGFNCLRTGEAITNNTDVYVFIDASSITYDEAVIAKNGVIDWHNKYSNRETGYTGNLYVMGVLDEKWLDWPNKVHKGEIELANFSSWSSFHILPANLNSGSWVPPTELMVIVIGNESATAYNSGNLGDNMVNEPTTNFINNYKSLKTNIEDNFTFFKGVLFPIITDTDGESAAFIRTALGSIEGVTLTNKEVELTNSPVNLNILTTTNPYEGYVIPGSSPQQTLKPLKELNWVSIYDQYDPPMEIFAGERFIKNLNKLLITK